MCDDGGRDVALGWSDADSGKGWYYCGGCEVVKAVFEVFVSEDPEGAFGESVYCGEFYCECVWTGVGGDACGNPGGGGVGEAGGGAERR